MAPLHHLCLCLPLLLLLPPPAAPAPAPRTDWAACRSLSLELSQRLMSLKEPHRVLEDTHLSEEDPENWPPRIRCSDACDPSTLDTNNTHCLQRILHGLKHYRDLLGSDIFTTRPLHQLQATLNQLLDQLLGPRQQERNEPPHHHMDPSEAWARPLLQRLALQRLQSFTAIMGRVFTHSASPH